MKREKLAFTTHAGKLDQGCVAAAFGLTYDASDSDIEHPFGTAA